MRQCARRLIPLLAMLAGGAMLVPVGANAAAGTCIRAGSEVQLSQVDGGADRIRVEADGRITNAGAGCGGATVSNTDRISVTGTAGDQALVIDMRVRTLEPGAPAEQAGVAEIEVQVAMAGGTDVVTILGRASARVLMRAGRGGIDVNGDGDVDVTASGVETLVLQGGRRDDVLAAGGGRGTGRSYQGIVRMVGGRGDDEIGGGDAADELQGGAGDDRLTGLAGADRLVGGGGSDEFIASAAADGADVLVELAGAAGVDTVDYSARADAVTVQVGAGTVSEDGDTVSASIERVVGGAGADRLVGHGGRNVLLGGAGDDVLDGRGGRDVLLGGSGNDTLTGGAGRDRLDGGAGADSFRARDGDVDMVIGGPDVDTANVDASDQRRGIEQRQ